MPQIVPYPVVAVLILAAIAAGVFLGTLSAKHDERRRQKRLANQASDRANLSSLRTPVPSRSAFGLAGTVLSSSFTDPWMDELVMTSPASTSSGVRADSFFDMTGTDINPATGLPMIGGFDVLGNPFGLDNSALSGTDWSSSFGSCMDSASCFDTSSSYGCSFAMDL